MHRILIVDDEAISTMVLSATLTDEGYDVRTSSSGEEAIQIGLDFRPHLLLSDWRLAKKVDGIEVARTLQANRPRTSVIMFSGLPADQLQAKAFDIRIFKILEKPCGIEELTDLVRSVLREESKINGADDEELGFGD